MKGGWTCANCEAHLDRTGRLISASLSTAGVDLQHIEQANINASRKSQRAVGEVFLVFG